MGDGCDHARTPTPSRPVPDWTGVCPDCGERVRHDGRGGFITVREVNDWIAHRDAAVHAATEQFRRDWVAANPLTAPPAKETQREDENDA